MDIFETVFEFTPDALVLMDERGRITRVNAQAEAMFGYRRHELVGELDPELLIPSRFAHAHVEHRAKYLAAPRSRPMGAGLELFGRRRDESEFPVDIMLSPIRTESETSTLCVVRDITGRRRAEALILDSLREKEVLLREIHHRVKNNLAVMSSLFYLQSTYTDDEPVIKILQESQDRVRSMAMVHESLYVSENLAAVNFAEYARNLTAQLLHTYSVTTREIRLTTDLEAITMSIDVAVPCGLILNELVTNAVKHAFGGVRDPSIHLRLRRLEGGFSMLSVADNGVGIPRDVRVDASTSLGLRIIGSLSRQIGGRFELLPANPGTEATLTLELSHGE